MFGPSFANKVAEEINKIRADPESYSKKITDYLQYFHGKVLRLPHESGIETQEGPDAYKEAAEFLSKAPKLPPLTIEPKLTEAAKEMAKESDLMIVVGSKKSANTTHLAEILKNITNTIHIENDAELNNYKNIIENSNKISITAGASTPQNVIEKVINKIEINN
jgi:hypothetical protein